MSNIAYVGMLITAVLGAFLGLRLGQRMANKNRDAKAEDPRDQAIRELRAELRIAQKSVDIAKSAEEKAQSDADDNQLELKKKVGALHDAEQKYAMTKDILSKEAQEKQELQDREHQYRLDADTLRNQIHELEIEAKLTGNSNMLLGSELADDSELEDAQNQIAELKQQLKITQSLSQNSDQASALYQSATEIAQLRSTVERLTDQASRAENLGLSLQEKTRLEQEVKILKRKAQVGENVSTRLTDTETRLNTATAEVTQLRGQLLESKNSSQRLAELEAELASTETSRAGTREIQRQLEGLQNNNAALAKQVEELSSAAGMTGKFQTQLNDSEIEKQELRKDIHKLQLIAKAAEKLKAELDRLRNMGFELKKSREEVARLSDKSRTEKASHAELEKIMQKQLGTERSSVNTLEASARDLAAQLESATQENNSTRARLTTSKDTESSLHALIDDYSRQLSALRSSQQTRSTQMTEMKIQLTTAQEMASTAVDESEQMVAKVAQLKADLATADDHMVEIEKLQQQLKLVGDQTTEIRKLQQQLELTGEQAEEISALKAMVIDASALHAELRASQERLDELQQDNEAKSAALQASEARLQELQDSSEQADSEITAMRVDIEQSKLHESEIQELREELEHLRADQPELLTIQYQLEKLESAKTRQADNIAKLEEALANSRKEASAANVTEVRTREELDKGRAERDELHTRTQRIQDSAANSIRISNEMVDRLQRQSAERDSLRQKNAELEATAIAAIAETEELRQEVFQIERSANRMDTQRTDLVDRLRNSIAENEGLKREISSRSALAEENTRLKTKLAGIKQSLLEREQQLKAAAVKTKETQAIHDCVTITDISGRNNGHANSTASTGSMLAITSAEDDLRKIKGVGEVLETKLRELGIQSFKHICMLGPDDFKRATELIPNLENRVKRDSWQTQAAKLHESKYNEHI